MICNFKFVLLQNFPLHLLHFRIKPISNFNSFPRRQILDSSKLKEMTIANLMKVAESSPNRVENTVGKGEIAYEQFLLFPQCFQKACTADT